MAIYTSVLVAENNNNLDGPANGYPGSTVVEVIGSGISDTRLKLLKFLGDPTITLIVARGKNRLTRLRFNYIEPCGFKRKTERILAELTETFPAWIAKR